MAWLSAPALIGPVLGPPIGGFLTTYLSWRWIFDINVPIGLLGMVLVYRYVPDLREASRRRLDAAGFVLAAVAMAAFMAGLETIGRRILPAPYPALLLALAVASALGYARHARRLADPLLDFSLLRIPTFLVSVLGGTLFRIGIGALPFLLPLMLQLGFGMNPLQSGLVTLASAAGAIVMKPAATTTLRNFGFRDTMLGTGLLAGITVAACALFRPAWPLWAIYAVLLAGGLFRSLQFTAYNTVAYADIPRPKMSAATSLYATIQQLSLTLGITAGASGLRLSMALLGHAHATNADFSTAFALVGAISLLAAPCSLLMRRSAGSDVSGHAAPLEASR
jgi:MFS family permease